MIEIKSIPRNHTYDWLKYKHYAKRIPSISYAFGLFIKKELKGVCTLRVVENFLKLEIN